MKKLLLPVVLCLLFTQLRAQDGVVFKIKYLPNHTYQTVISVGMKLNATLSGDQQLIDKLKSQGITQPVLANLGMAMSGTMKTGAVGADNSFPIDMDYKIDSLNVFANGKQAPIPQNITGKDFKAVGHISQGWQIQLDSVAGKKVADSAEKKMKQMMDIVQKQIKFPDAPLKPGDTFKQGSPMNIPINANKNIQIDAGVVYKLVSISDGKAYFDLTPNFSMDFKIKNTSISVIGTGAGKMIYSIKDNFPLSKVSNFNMKIKVTSDKLNVDGTAAITTSYNCIIN